MFAQDSRQLNRHLLLNLIVDKHRCFSTKMASEQNGAKSALLLSEKSAHNVPFSHVRDEAIYDHTAGDEMVGLETDYENLVENLDELSEEQLDELLREARDINQRLRSVERKQTIDAHRGSMADHEEMTTEESASGPCRSHFLPPIQQTKTAMVTQVNVMKGIVSTQAERVGRREKSTVT